MAKYIIGIIAFCFVFSINGNSYGQCAVRAKVVKTYLAEIGVREATGHNDGTRVEQYFASCKMPKGNAWCAAFVNWTFIQSDSSACITLPKSPAWSPSWFPDKRVIYSRNTKPETINPKPEPGDVFGLYFESKKRIAHVGFIHEWGTDWVITVEGNTNEAGSREGDGVYKKRRPTRTIYKVSRWID